MKEQKTNRSKLLQVRVTPKEMENVTGRFLKSTCRKLSDYIRKKILDKPIHTYTRNQSLDDFMAEMIALKNELNAIGNNFNQAVKKLNALQHTDEVKSWIETNESSKQTLLQKVEQIKSKISQINDQWLQS